MYEVRFQASAKKEIKRIPSEVLSRLKLAVMGLSAEPRPVQSRKLVNVSPETWRIRVGDWRVLYFIDDSQKIVEVVHVFHRREAYR
jgi:mRNA interferase RelE/StbE